MQSGEEIIDPGLRSAIKRARGGHVADQQLRSTVEKMLADELARKVEPQNSFVMRWVIRGAIAASLLLAGGVIQQVRHEWQEEREYTEANNSLFAAMVNAHEHPAATGDVQEIANLEPAALRDELSNRLNRQPPLPDLKSQSWTVSSASIRPFEGAVAGRINFTNASRRATLLTLPQFAMIHARDGFTYDIVVDGHPISGFVANKGVHCIIGDVGMSLDEITSLRKQLQKS